MERRATTRVSYATAVTVVWDGRPLTGRVDDLSLRGLRFHTDDVLPMGTPVAVYLDLSAGARRERLAVEGRVARHDDAAVGIRFESMSLETFAALRRVVGLNSGRPDAIEEELRAQLSRDQGAPAQKNGERR
ncbi:MAG: PilZ domain-containing protein [Planctomycetota bacterium]